MITPKSEEEMQAIIDKWDDISKWDSGDEMRYFSSEILSIIKFMEGEIMNTPTMPKLGY